MSEPVALAGPPLGPDPLAPSERLGALDVVRGFALLGILTMNILQFGLPSVARLNPEVVGGFEGRNFAAWWICYLLFDEKMITLFSMLFGAGLVLMSGRAEARGSGSARLFYRRAAVLLLLGLLHAYLLWEGDILFTYALCGMAVYPLRNRSPRTLLVLGVCLLAVATFLSLGFSAVLNGGAPGPGAAPDPLVPTPEALADDIRLHARGSYGQIFVERAATAFTVQALLFPVALFWVTAGRMLIGIALMRLQVLSGRRTARFYVGLLLAGYGVGLPLAALSASAQLRHGFDFVRLFGGDREANNYGSLFVALGHASALILIYKAGVAPWLSRRLAAAGRMALTNYLLQSLLCTLLFYGYGLGLYGSLDRVQLLGVVAGVWALQLTFSPVWLGRFRFGPVEWLWRSLTYWKLQPMVLPAR